MADVFISYASEDRARAVKLAGALETRGWSVWLDRKIVVGKTFDQVIEHELESARSVVVLWSKDSISSEWVKNEAAVAAERGALVPALIDSVKPPLEFRRRQAADLVGWKGDLAHGGFQALCDGITEIVTNTGVAPSQKDPPPRPALQPNRYWRLGAMGTIAIMLGIGAHWALIDAPQEPDSSHRDEKSAGGDPETAKTASAAKSPHSSTAAQKTGSAARAKAPNNISGKWVIEETEKIHKTYITIRMLDGKVLGSTEILYPDHPDILFSGLKRQAAIFDGEVVGNRLSFKTKRTYMRRLADPTTMTEAVHHYDGRIDGEKIHFSISLVGGDYLEATAVRLSSESP